MTTMACHAMFLHVCKLWHIVHAEITSFLMDRDWSVG